MSSRTYFLVIYEQGKTKTDNNAKKGSISEQTAKKILADNGNPTLTRKEDGLTYKILEKRLFEFVENGKEKVLFIIVDAVKL